MSPSLRRALLASPFLLSACHAPAEPALATAVEEVSGVPLEAAGPRARTVASPVFLDEFLREGLADPRAMEQLTELCSVAPHRLAGSQGAARAVEWGRQAMLAAGLENVRLEPVMVPRWERGEVEELVVVEPAAHAGERLSILALGGSVGTPSAGLEADVIAVQTFEELTARAAEARGKFVLFARAMDRSKLDPFEAYGGAVRQRGRGAEEAERVGAVGALVRSMTLKNDDHPHTGAMQYDDDAGRVPAAALSIVATERVNAWLAAGERVRLRLSLSCQWYEDVPSHNVVGEVVGRELPDEVVLVGGHLDAWDVGDGAHDDGAGCVHALEACRLILRSSLGRPRRTVRCVFFMNEENGLRGGQAYRDTHFAELAQHVLAIESDRGGGLPAGYTAEAGEAGDALLAELWGGPAAGRGGGADISPLAQDGVPLAGFYPSPQRYFDYHHSANDVLEAVHPRELQLGAISLASMAWLAAEHAGPWPRAAAQSSGGH
jgi:hypothetical protein